jgi:hypothetical protein
MSSVLTPADSLNFKITTFFILIIINLPFLISKSFNKSYQVLGFHFFVFFPIVFLTSLLRGGSLVTTITSSYFILFSGLNLILLRYNINFQKLFFLSLQIMAGVIFISFLFDIFGIIDIYSNLLLVFLYENGEAFIGKSNLYWSFYVFFMKASPLLVFYLGYFLYKRNLLLAILISITLALTGTRGNLLSMFLINFVYYFINLKRLEFKIIFSFIIIIITFLLFRSIYEYFNYITVSKLSSDLSKNNDINEILSLFLRYPNTIFFGTGFGNDFKYELTKPISEVSLLDLWRKIGIFNLFIFLYFIFKPVFKIWKAESYRWVAYSFVIYFIISMTNPLLFSTTAYIAYSFVYYNYYKIK